MSRVENLLRAITDLLTQAGLGNRYAIIGGVAVAAYVPGRETKDVDVLLDSMASIEKLRKAVLTSKTGFKINKSPIPRLFHRFGKVDVLPANHDPLWRNALASKRRATAFGSRVYVVSKASLIELKRQAGREDPSQRTKAVNDLVLLTANRESEESRLLYTDPRTGAEVRKSRGVYVVRAKRAGKMVTIFRTTHYSQALSAARSNTFAGRDATTRTRKRRSRP